MPDPRMKSSKRIELMLRNIDALFNPIDPTPLPEKTLNAEVEAFIVGFARQHAADLPLLLRMHLKELPSHVDLETVSEAVHHYFATRGELTAMEFRRLMREGRMSLMIGLAFLFACLLAQRYLLSREDDPLLVLLRESLTIAGWVGMWQPVQIYLYDWWPLRRRRLIFEKLSRVPLEWALPPASLRRAQVERLPDQPLADSFPASDPVSTLADDSPPRRR